MRRFGVGLFAVFALLITSCAGQIGSGRVVSEQRQVSGFDTVVLSGSGEMTITQGAGEALTIEAEDNLISLIESKVTGKTLTIGGRPGAVIITPRRPIKYALTVKDLRELDISGAAAVRAESLGTDQLRVSLSGAGSIEISGLEATSLQASTSGAGGLKFVGTVSDQRVQLSGLGGYEAGDLRSQRAQVTISGAGGATVWATESLDVNISGAGSVRYYGSPSVNQEISGAGGVTGLGDK